MTTVLYLLIRSLAMVEGIENCPNLRDDVIKGRPLHRCRKSYVRTYCELTRLPEPIENVLVSSISLGLEGALPQPSNISSQSNEINCFTFSARMNRMTSYFVPD